MRHNPEKEGFCWNFEASLFYQFSISHPHLKHFKWGSTPQYLGSITKKGAPVKIPIPLIPLI